MAHNYHHHDPSFLYSQQHPQAPQPPLQPPPPALHTSLRPSRKAKKCRKRHPPVGPAGIWFLSRTPNNKNNNKGSNGNGSSRLHHESNNGAPFGSQDDDDEGDNLHNSSANSVVGSNPAWMAMQCSLQWLTPDVSPTANFHTNRRRHHRYRLLTPLQRYQRLRPHIPNNFTLLPQLQYGSTTSTYWKLPAGQKLMVLVHAVTCHHEDIWTVELHDDTGSSIQAWIQPSFVQSERQKSSQEGAASDAGAGGGGEARSQPYIRPGYVWCLQDVTIMLEQPMSVDDEEDYHAESNNNNSSSNNGAAKRMLLISQRNVERVWTPDSLQQTDETDFVQWMEQRDAFQTHWEEEHLRQNPVLANNNNGSGQNESAGHNDHPGNNDEPEEEDEEEEEDDGDIYRRYRQRSSRFSIHGDDEENEENNVMGGVKLQSLHTNIPSSNMDSRSQPQQQQQQPQGQNIAISPRATIQPLQELPSSEEKEEDNEATAMLMRTLMRSSQPPTHQSSQASQQGPRLQLLQQAAGAQFVPPQRQPLQVPVRRQAQLTEGQQHQPHPSQQQATQQEVNPHARNLTLSHTQQNQQPRSQQRQPSAIASTCSQLNAPSQQKQSPANGRNGPWSQPNAFSQIQVVAQQQSAGQAQALMNGQQNARNSRRVSFSQVPPSIGSSPQQQSSPYVCNSVLQNRENLQERRPPRDQNLQVAPPEKPQQKKKPVDLNQFSAKPTAAATKPQPALPQGKAKDNGTVTEKSQNMEEPINSQTKNRVPAPTPSENERNKTPPKQHSQSKDGTATKRKRKKAKYDTSPLSQSLKPDASKLWTTALPGGDGLLGDSFLGLSSDEDDDDDEKRFPHKENTLQQAAAKINPQVTQNEPKSTVVTDDNNGMNSGFGGGISSLFQTASMPGMDWLNLSDEDDD